MNDFIRGAKLHPGWLIAASFWLIGVAIRPEMVMMVGGLIWFVPVLLTCKAVGRANRDYKP